VVDEGDEVTAPAGSAGALEEGRALEVDVPQLVGVATLVARTGHTGDAWAVAAGSSQQAVDLAMAQRPDLAPTQLGRQATAVPVGQEAHRQDQPLDDRRQLDPAAGLIPIEQPFDAVLREAASPSEQRR